MSVSKKIRFEVFKRDGFQCAYCGKSPPEVMLECDHINPKSAEGTDEINNLLTACFDCNRGKRNIPLEKIPTTMSVNLEILKEKELQIQEYQKFVRKIEKRIQADIQKIDDIYNQWYEGWVLADKFKQASLKRFINILPLQFVIDSMHQSCSKMQDKDQAIRYFCGICWNKIKGKGFHYGPKK